eukprot:1159884-Pelagomonas_calceolata.AAC.1
MASLGKKLGLNHQQAQLARLASLHAGPELRASGHLGTPPLFSDTSRQQQQQQTNAQATPETDWLDKPGL